MKKIAPYLSDPVSHLSIGSITIVKGMENVPIMFMSFNKYLFLEVINILV